MSQHEPSHPAPTHRSSTRRRGRFLVVLAAVGALLTTVSAAAWALEAQSPSGRQLAPVQSQPTVASAPRAAAELSRDERRVVPTRFAVRKGRTFKARCMPVPARTITVLTYNIHSAVSERGLALGRIAAELRAWGPDIVALQEVDDNRTRTDHVDQARWLADQLGMTSTYAAAEQQGDGSYGNAILSRFPVVSSTSHRLPATGTGLSNPRVLLRTVVEIDGFELTVDSTHFSNTSEPSRVMQARTVAGLHDDPRIVMGDLNSSTNDRPLDILRTDLVDAWDQVGTGTKYTHHTRHSQARIDFVLYSGELTPTFSQVMQSSVSDHDAVLTRFVMQPPCQFAGSSGKSRR